MRTPEIPGIENFELVDTGANSAVWVGTETDLDRRVAIKVIRFTGDGSERRFERERKALGRLTEINGVVTIYRTGLTSDDEPFIVMGYHRTSLQDILNDIGPMPWQEAVAIMSTVALTVQKAHDHDVLHLDLKPSNILLNGDNEPLVADFGISELTDTTASLSGAMMTPNYAAPERFLDSPPTPAVDIYGLGATLLALLTGTPPFHSQRTTGPGAIMQRVLNEAPDLDGLTIPDWLTETIRTALDKNPDQRQSTARALADQLTIPKGPTERNLTSSKGPPPRVSPTPVRKAKTAHSTDSPPGADDPTILKAPSPLAQPKPTTESPNPDSGRAATKVPQQPKNRGKNLVFIRNFVFAIGAYAAAVGSAYLLSLLLN